MSRIATFHATNKSIYVDNLSFFSRCFTDCVKDFKTLRLTPGEVECSRFCIEKHIEAGINLGKTPLQTSQAINIGKHIISKRDREEKDLAPTIELQAPVEESE